MTSDQDIQELVDHIESVNFIGSGNDRLILDDRHIEQPFRVEWKREGVFVHFIASS